MKKNAPIGIFDSGVGGLTVFKELHNLLPNENYIYFGDTANMPYGTKSKPKLIQITTKILDYFASRDVKAVVIACNTTSATAYDELKNKYNFKIYPIIQTVAEEFSKLPIRKLGVLSTPATANSHAYLKEINKYNNTIEVFEEPCFDWTQIVENGTYNSQESLKIIEEHLYNLLNKQVEKIVLGCTHYPYLLDTLSKYTERSMFLNPAKYFVNSIINDLKNKDLLNDQETTTTEFIVSANSENFKIASKMFYDVKEAKELNFSCVNE